MVHQSRGGISETRTGISAIFKRTTKRAGLLPSAQDKPHKLYCGNRLYNFTYVPVPVLSSVRKSTQTQLTVSSISQRFAKKGYYCLYTWCPAPERFMTTNSIAFKMANEFLVHETRILSY